MARDPGRFKGLLTNVDPKDVPPGYHYAQRNLGNFRPGRLDVRPGLHSITHLLSNISPADTEEKIGVLSHSAPHTSWLIGHRTDGSVKAYRNLASGTVPIIPTADLFDRNYPCCYVRDSIDGLLIFNGIERGYRWDGIYKGSTASAFQAGVKSPEDVAASSASPPTMADNTGISTKLTASADYISGYRYRDEIGYVSNLSEVAEFTAHANGYAQNWSALVASDQAVDTTHFRVRYIELFRSVGNNPAALYLVARTGNRGAITSASGNGTTTTINLYSGHGLVAKTVITIAGVSGLTTLTLATVTATTATGLSAYNSTDSDGGTWVTTGYTGDSLTDEELLANSSEDTLPLFNDDKTIFARSFGLPPDDKPFFASYQGTMFAYGRVNYSAGTATGTINTTSVTLGGGAQAKTEWVGRSFIDPSSTEVKYVITAVNEGTNVLTIDRPLAAALVAAAYVVTPDQTRANLLCFSRPGFQESFLETDAIRVQQATDATDRETGLLQFGAYLYVLHEYHIYQVVFSSDPRYDGHVLLAGYRGAVNNRSAAIDHGTAYIFDQKGGYRIEGPCCPTDISSTFIRNLFQDTIDWAAAKKKWYFASVDPSYRIIRYHVGYIGDSTTYPSRAICYNTQTGEWWEEQYPFEVCGATEYEISGQMRLVLAGPDDRFLVCGILGDGDGVKTTAQSAVVSYVTGALTVGTSIFASTQVGYPIYVVSGPGAGESGVIATYSSGTVVTVSGASSGLASITTGSVVVIGAVAGYLKTGMLEIIPPMDQQEGKPAAVTIRREIAIAYDPTTYDSRIAASLFLNNKTTAEEAQSNYEERGVSWTNRSPYITFSSIRSRVPRGEEPGRKIIKLDKAVSHDARADIYLTTRIDVVQGVDQLSIRAVDITGFG